MPDAETITDLPQAVTEPWRVQDRGGFSLTIGIDPKSATLDVCRADTHHRGACPQCGETEGGFLLGNLYQHVEFGYLLRYECARGLMDGGVSCDFYRVP